MILEGIVTTSSPDGTINIAPMGPRVDAAMERFVLRPYRTAQTYRNLKAHGEGVLHVTDDVLLLAQAALGPITPAPRLVPASQVRGFVLADACRFWEFRVSRMDEREERVTIEAEVVHHGQLRDFFGLNRAKHAVVEAAILATRTDFLDLGEIEAEFRKLAVIIRKTGGEQERQAFAFLQEHLDRKRVERGGRPVVGGGSGVPLHPPPTSQHPPPATRVQTPSRLHFGLLTLGAVEPASAEVDFALARQFGGVGLMVRQPGIRVSVRPASEWQVEGPLAERALGFASEFLRSCGVKEPPPCRIVVETDAPEHAGLGTGTQLGLAVARLLAATLGVPTSNPIELARRVGRGRRSALGIHGFAHGGFLVEGGKRAPDDIAPLVARAAFPEEWRILLIHAAGQPGLHGIPESQAFDQLQSRAAAQAISDSPEGGRRKAEGGRESIHPSSFILHPSAFRMPTERLCRLVLLGMLPALVDRDLAAFGEALYEFNALVGEAFAPIQGGTYAPVGSAEIVCFLRQQGVRGVGQTSWGPTLFAVASDEDQAAHLADRVGQRFGLGPAGVLVTQACNQGATLVEVPEEAAGV